MINETSFKEQQSRLSQLVFTVLLASSLWGCEYQSRTEPTPLLNSVADTNFFNDRELIILKNSVQLISSIYREGGVYGMKNYIDNCYGSPSVDPLACIGADYTAHMIDKNISSHNNFPPEEYFYENKVIARIITTKDFNEENLPVLFSVVSVIKQKIIVFIKEINSDYEVNTGSDSSTI
jgi:hypothetical protein